MDESRMFTMEDRIGRIDVHSHLLPGIDDGCKTLEESLDCARLLAGAGYTHSFCTPHVWPSLPENNAQTVGQRDAHLQASLGEAGIPLRLFPGGEINLNRDTAKIDRDQVVSYGMTGRYALIDIWIDRIPAFFEPGIRALQSLGLKVILAHPERMRLVQNDPGVIELFAEMGLLLQGNLQCLSDPPTAATRRIAEDFLLEGKYFLLGSDLHGLDSLPPRLEGLRRAIDLVGEEAVDQLTRKNPLKLLPGN